MNILSITIYSRCSPFTITQLESSVLSYAALVKFRLSQSLIIPEPQSLKILRLSFKEEHGYTFIDKSFLTMFTGVKILSRVRERTLENSVNKQDLGVKRQA